MIDPIHMAMILQSHLAIIHISVILKELFVCAAEGCIFLVQPRIVNTICHAICPQQNGIATAIDYD